MAYYPPGRLMSFLDKIPDPRKAMGKRHPLVAMLTHAVCAVLCGCRGSAAIAQWGRDQPIEFMHRLGYRRTPPSYGSFQGLLSHLDAAALQSALTHWLTHVLGKPAVEELRATSLDGKTSRGSLTPYDAAVHLLAAFDQKTGGVLRQMRVDGKTNEQKAALELLKGLTLQGRVVTGDAMFCQRDLSEQIVQNGGHDLWKVDDNQPALKEAIASAFEPAFSPLRPAQASRPGGPDHDARRARRADRTAATDGHDDAGGVSGLARCGAGVPHRERGERGC